MSCMGRGLCRILSMWMVFGDTSEEDETNRRVCALFHLFPTMKKILILVLFVFLYTLNVNAQEKVSSMDFIDLGLSSGNLWAKANLGALEYYEVGNYYAWGETETKTNFTKETYKYYKCSIEKDANGFDVTYKGFVKYVISEKSDYGYKGFYDNITTLEPSDDAVYAELSNDCCMPKVKDCEELYTLCIWTECSINNVKGWKVTGPNGNYIFFPCGGYYKGSVCKRLNIDGCYWASDYRENSNSYFRKPCNIDLLYLGSGHNYAGEISGNSDYRIFGLNIRAIKPRISIVVNTVIDLIGAIGKIEHTQECKVKIDAANNAYNALTANQKALVTNLDVLTTAKQTYETLKAAAEKLTADKAKAEPVIAKINAIGKVEYTETCKDKIDDASAAYEALTADQKVLVTNLDILNTAKQTYDNLKAAAEKLATDKALADPVIAKINAIGKVEYTYACKDKIDEANNAYNALTADQKALVTNLDILTTAKQTYEELKAAAEKFAADKAVADPVIAKINAIGKVEYTYACKDKIDEANNAYNALTADQKALVTNIDVLTTAKLTYDALKAAADELMAYKTAFENYKSELRAIIEALGKEDDSDAVKNIINKAISDIDALEYDVIISLDDNKVKVNSLVTSVNEAVENQRAEDQKTTGINELQITNDELPVYDLNGKKITNSMLKSGLYIRNGKKVVVK